MYDVLVFENQLAPQVVLDLNATDEIAHRPVQYAIVGNDYNGLFAIEPDTGRLSVTSSLDREATPKYVVKVRAMSKKRVGRAIRDNIGGKRTTHASQSLNRSAEYACHPVSSFPAFFFFLISELFISPYKNGERVRIANLAR